MSLPAIPYLATKPPAGVQINPLHPLSRGLVGYWLFNEGSGSRAADISGHGNHGTLKNMSPNAQDSGWGGSKFGGGLQFDGVDDYVDCGNNASLDITDAITVEAWVNINVDESGRIASKHGGGSYGWTLIRGVSNDNIEWRISTTGSDWNGGFTSLNIFKINTWYHIVATYDGSYMRMYVNGVEDTGGDFPVSLTGSINVAPASTQIGRDEVSGTSGCFPGTIDEVRIYNHALTAAEVKQLYHDPFCNLLRVPIRYVAAGGYDVSMSLTMSPALANSAQASAGASLSLDQIAAIADGGQANMNAAATLSDLLGISKSALATAGASLTLAKGMSISADATSITDATLSLAQTLTITQATGQYIDASLSLAQSLGILDSAQVTAQASVLLSKIMAVSHAAAANTAASLSLAYHAALVNDANETVSASIALAIQQGVSTSVSIDYGASLGLAQSLGLSGSAQATTGATLALTQNLALVLLAQAVVDAGLSLDAVQFITTTATAIIAGLETPDGRTVIITFETRTTTIAEENRTMIIPSAN